MGLFSSLIKSKKYEDDFASTLESLTDSIAKDDEREVTIEFPDDEIVQISSDIIDTRSYENELKLKHNLSVLIKRAKKNNSVDNFVIIREDDIFPDNWEWLPSSDYTTLEYESINLSYMLRKRIAESKLKKIKIGDIELPHTRDEIDEELNNMDKTIGNVYMPSYFRSTKHFTINTPLGVTGDYNAVESGRKFIIIDNMDNFLNSGYAYSVGYRDAYLDVTHESLKISDDAIVLIDSEKYDEIMKDENIAEQLKMRRVIKYTGDETLAIDMVLSEMSILPSRIGMKYAFYDETTQKILESSIKKLAEKNNLLFNKSHAGPLTLEGGHFSNYYDDKNYDRRKYFSNLAKFIESACPGVNFDFTFMMRVDEQNINNLIDTIGAFKLLSIIEEYNTKVKEEFMIRKKTYLSERKQITEEIHDLFISTIGLIDDYYMSADRKDEGLEFENLIQLFFQSKTLEEQIESAKEIQKILNKSISIKEESNNKNKLL